MSGPSTLMFIRHGEKPGEHVRGVNVHGEEDPHALSVRGWTRAGALAALFGHAPSSVHPGIVTPGRVFATKASAKEKSRREVDTARPTAERLGVTLDDSFAHGDERELVAALLADERPALVVWHHGNLPALLAHLPIANAADVPREFPEDRFDLVWVLSGGAPYTFSVVAQDLIQGDAATA